MIKGLVDTDSLPVGRWSQRAVRILAGESLLPHEAEEILSAPREEILELLSGAYRLRHHYFSNRVQLYFLVNAKSGICPEDCHYCSQSKISDAEIPKYKILSEEELLEGARRAAQLQSRTYCIVISGRSPTPQEMRTVTSVVPRIKKELGLHICACLGLLTPDLARELKACGVDRVNHNLNTGEDHYEEICTTHTYADRVETLQAVRDAGLEMCSGGIIGMGEKAEHIVQMAFALRDLGVQSIPVNFLNPIEGTPLETRHDLDPIRSLQALAMFRFVNPDREIRIAGGREIQLRSLQPLGLFAANSIFVGDYLTTKGQLPSRDYQMISDLGFQIVVRNEQGEEIVCDPPEVQADPLAIVSN
ncbi:biotin synthase BioB [bacterium]|nr:biotin synthase BioB [bacterium]